MQLAKPTLKLAALAVLIAHGALAAAQGLPPAPVMAGPAAAPVAPGLPPAGVAAPAGPGNAVQQVTSAGAVKAVGIGKPDETPGGTLKELETLQRDAYLGELRAKIRTLNADTRQAPAAAASYDAGTNPAQRGTTAPAFGGRLITPPIPQPAQPFGGYPYPTMAPMGAPTVEASALLVSVIVSGGRSRADVMDGGIVKTVKQGDRLGEWAVVAIDPTGVKVEKEVPVPVRTPAPDRKPGKAAKAAVVVPPAPEVRIVSAMLKPYIPPAPVQVNAASAGGIQNAVVPPLPAQIKYPDSSSISAASPMTPR